MKKIIVSDYSIKLILYDFDGVMTDNKVTVSEDGRESVVCNRSDGLAVARIKEWGVPQAIISTETNKVVAVRASKLDIPVIHGVSSKKEIVLAYCNKTGVDPRDALYIGNDLNDLEAMLAVGFPACPRDAYREIKEISKLVLPAAGGCGVIRELLNYIHFGGEEK